LLKVLRTEQHALMPLNAFRRGFFECHFGNPFKGWPKAPGQGFFTSEA
jgi:hypothetical protein